MSVNILSDINTTSKLLEKKRPSVILSFSMYYPLLVSCLVFLTLISVDGLVQTSRYVNNPNESEESEEESINVNVKLNGKKSQKINVQLTEEKRKNRKEHACLPPLNQELAIGLGDFNK